MSVDPRFEQLLKDKIGLDAITVGASVIERAVRRCMANVPGRDLDTFWQDLRNSEAELQALIEAVIVPETWFFRYPESFATLARLASRRVLELAGTRPLRVLSLPCSTGEEPYSIAMCLLDAGLAPQAFSVDALDISPLSIARATAGHYGRNSFRGETLAFRNRYFSADGTGYAINAAVRQQVRFQAGNLLEPGLLAGQQAYDFVFCRN
ncbi:MAG: protein-glutamate O-methyltransferase CheR, partial [Pseudomonas sp.]